MFPVMAKRVLKEIRGEGGIQLNGIDKSSRGVE
jgi:hypothetical protein